MKSYRITLDDWTLLREEVFRQVREETPKGQRDLDFAVDIYLAVRARFMGLIQNETILNETLASWGAFNLAECIVEWVECSRAKKGGL